MYKNAGKQVKMVLPQDTSKNTILALVVMNEWKYLE